MAIETDYPQVYRFVHEFDPFGAIGLMKGTPTDVLKAVEEALQNYDALNRMSDKLASGESCAFDHDRICNAGVDDCGVKCQAWQDTVDFGPTKLDGHCMRIGRKITAENSRVVPSSSEQIHEVMDQIRAAVKERCKDD